MKLLIVAILVSAAALASPAWAGTYNLDIARGEVEATFSSASPVTESSAALKTAMRHLRRVK